MRIRLVWVPSFVVGACAATASAVAVALLLYSGEGMLRSLTLIVAVELVAFGVGLATPLQVGHLQGVVESLRRRWLAALLTFLAASVFSLAWTFGNGFGAGASSQALGLAMVGGLPLYACGRLLAGIGTVATAIGGSSSGAFASLGAALGVLLTGSGGLSRMGAPTLLLVLLVMLSGAAMMQGSIVDALQEGVDRDVGGSSGRAISSGDEGSPGRAISSGEEISPVGEDPHLQEVSPVGEDSRLQETSPDSGRELT